ncbi:hypothetical protein [Dactylosporangium matsuzakiense]|uniref:Uncharacterized protein n=1 Tax=Dactylosporangium matsuzakiense TaxID=53360 RepID=A0A9W6KS99_9ACTN|nr:hypothetical protein [Dactylosporangium matsuzakiense]UWZ43887.1 hypothetical protein Dmats_41800 [Dactylosporangium matsuzakiense]GLL06318.1 hypothetical protein GCM10017581_080670 [Dactylosporangium matsuzakiense]
MRIGARLDTAASGESNAELPALAEAGLTSYATDLERTMCLLRAVALGVLYRDFFACAFDDGPTGEWRDGIGSDLIGPHPLTDSFTLGQLAERQGVG